MKRKELAAFSQELYYDESIRAIEAFADISDLDGLREKIAQILPQHSESTRLRIASKIIQRFFKSPDGRSLSSEFLKLTSQLKNDSARRDLIYWRTSRIDLLISAIASEIFYPFFVLQTLPAGYNEATFRMDNTASLFPIDSIITRDFVIKYAKKAWAFENVKSITLALRIMKQAQILDAISVSIGRRRILGYYPRPHSPNIEAFAYCLYEESLGCGNLAILSLDHVQNHNFAKVCLVSRLQVDSMLRETEKKGLISFLNMSGGRHVKLTLPSLGDLVEKLLCKAT